MADEKQQPIETAGRGPTTQSTQETCASATGTAAKLAGAPIKGVGNYRWTICAVLFFATTINYLDRAVLGLLAPTLQKTIGWSESHYGYINSAFTAAYGIGMLVAGGLLDRFGTRIGFAVSIFFWSIACMGHAFASAAWGFGIARFALGLGESGNFPACVKTVAEWFPKKERALATGIFNAGSNVGILLAPLVVWWLTEQYGWQSAFLATGGVGVFLLVAWLLVYKRPDQHTKITAAELAHIRSDPPDPVGRVPWGAVLPHRPTWAFAIGKLMTDPVWWFYLFWVGKFLDANFGLKLSELPLPVIAIYLAADVGSVAAGWMSSSLIKRGWSINSARKVTMLLCASCVVPVMVSPITKQLIEKPFSPSSVTPLPGAQTREVTKHLEMAKKAAAARDAAAKKGETVPDPAIEQQHLAQAKATVANMLSGDQAAAAGRARQLGYFLGTASQRKQAKAVADDLLGGGTPAISAGAADALRSTMALVGSLDQATSAAAAKNKDAELAAKASAQQNLGVALAAGGDPEQARAEQLGFMLGTSGKYRSHTADLVAGEQGATAGALQNYYGQGRRSAFYALWLAVILIGLAAAAHQGWSCNLFTIVSDTFPRNAVGSVVGIGGMAGAFGGMVVTAVIGRILDQTGQNYVPIFAVFSLLYLVALLIIHMLTPRLEPVNLQKNR